MYISDDISKIWSSFNMLKSMIESSKTTHIPHNMTWEGCGGRVVFHVTWDFCTVFSVINHVISFNGVLFPLWSPAHYFPCDLWLLVIMGKCLHTKLKSNEWPTDAIDTPAKPLHNHGIVSVHFNQGDLEQTKWRQLYSHLHMAIYLNVDECWLTSLMSQHYFAWIPPMYMLIL